MDQPCPASTRKQSVTELTKEIPEIDHEGEGCDDGLSDMERSLHQAVKEGNEERVKSILISATSGMLDVNKKDSDNWSCLHEACIHNCQFTKIAELLLQHGADPDIRDNSGETPLHGAVLFHFTDNVKLLCDYKADFTACNNDGISSLDIAEYAKDIEVLEIFGRPTVEKKGKGLKQRRKPKRAVLRPRNIGDLNHVPSPLSSPSILKKRRRTSLDDGEEGICPSPKKTITFSAEDRYSPSPLYR